MKKYTHPDCCGTNIITEYHKGNILTSPDTLDTPDTIIVTKDKDYNTKTSKTVISIKAPNGEIIYIKRKI